MAGVTHADEPPAAGPALAASPLLVLELSGRVTLVARFDEPLALRGDGRPAGRARIDRQPARLRAVGRPGRACVTARGRQDGGTGEPPRPLHAGRTYTVRIVRTPDDTAPVVRRVVLRRARPGDVRGEPLGCP